MGTGEILTHTLFAGAIAVIIYFFFIAPQRKQRQEQQDFLETLKVGDKVVTVGGIHGIVVDMTEHQIVMQMENNAECLMEKQALSAEITNKLYRQPPKKPSKQTKAAKFAKKRK